MNMNRRRAPSNVIAATLRSLVFLQLMLPLLLLLLLLLQPTFADATILTDHFADIEIDNDDCSLVQCSAPPLCPADSRPSETSADVDDLEDEYDQLATSDPFDGMHIEALGPIEFSSDPKESTTTTATTATTTSKLLASTAAGAARAARVKRSLQRLQQRIWKRDLNILRMGSDAADGDGDDGASADATLDVDQQTCCPEYECVCNDCALSEHSASRCTADEVALEMSSASGEPGSCCARFECVKRWQCDAATRSDEYWKSECTKCRCFGGEELCADLCDKSSSAQQQRNHPHQHHQHHQPQHQHQRDEARASSCYSDYLDQLMFEGETWLEDAACSECTCQEGEKMCITNFCAAAECESPRKVEGQCCPVCAEGEESPKEMESEGSEKAPGATFKFEASTTTTTALATTVAPDSTPHSTPSESTTELLSAGGTEVNATQNTESQIETTATTTTTLATGTTTTTTTTTTAAAEAAITNDSLNNKNLSDDTTASPDTSTEAMTVRTSVSVAAVVVDEDADESTATKATATTSGSPAANETETTTTTPSTRTTDTESNNNEIVSSRSSATTSDASSTESHSVTSVVTPSTEASAAASAGTTTEGPETKYGELQTDAASASSEGRTTATRTTGKPATSSSSVTTPSYTVYSFGTTSPSAAIGTDAPRDTTVTQSIVSRFRVTSEPRFSAPATSTRSDPRHLLPHDVYTHGFAVSSTTTSSDNHNLNAVPLLKTPPTDVISSTGSNNSHNILHIFHKVDSVLIVGLALGALLSLTLGLIIRHNRNKTKRIYSTIPSSETSLSQTSTNTMFTV